MTPQASRMALLALFAVGLVLRLWAAFVAAPSGFSWGDEVIYLRRAASILETLDPGTAWQVPLYPYLLAAAKAIAADELAAARWANVGLYPLSALGLVLLAGDARRALGFMAVLALHPLLVAFSWLVLAETLFVTLFVWALALQRVGTPAALVGSGLLWGLTTLTRPLGLPFFALSMLLHGRAFPGDRKFPHCAALLLAGYAIALGPWLVRNQQVLGVPSLTTSSGFNLWVGNEREVSPAYAWKTGDLGIFYEHYLEFSDDELERDRIAMDRALAFIADEQPTWFFWKTTAGISHLLAHENYVMRRLYRNVGKPSPALHAAVAVVTYGGELIVVAWGVYMLLQTRRSPRAWLALAMIVAATAIHTVTIGDSRHRLGIEMVLFVLAGSEPRPISRRMLLAAVLITALLVVVGAFAPEVGAPRLFPRGPA